jgi:hypothetical protein
MSRKLAQLREQYSCNLGQFGRAMLTILPKYRMIQPTDRLFQHILEEAYMLAAGQEYTTFSGQYEAKELSENGVLSAEEQEAFEKLYRYVKSMTLSYEDYFDDSGIALGDLSDSPFNWNIDLVLNTGYEMAPFMESPWKKEQPTNDELDAPSSWEALYWFFWYGREYE